MASPNIRDTVVSLLSQIAEAVGAGNTIQSGQDNPVVSSNQSGIQTVGPSTSGLATPSSVREFVTEQPMRNPSRIASSVLQEVSTRFAPYTDTPRTRLVGRSGKGVRNRVIQQRLWSHRCICLAKPSTVTTPGETAKMMLGENGLGDGVLQTGNNATSQEVERALRIVYPRLSGVEFELLKSIGPGKGKPLARISAQEPIPAVAYIRASRETLESEETGTNMEIEESNSSGPILSTSGFSNIATHELQGPSTFTSSVRDLELENVETNNTINSISDIVTLTDYREQLYTENPGVQFIFVRREEYLNQVLGVYKDPAFNFFKKPKVEFYGEPGNDVAALTREYFWRGLLSLVQERLDGRPLFEGQTNHLVPSCDARLARSGVFATVGKFIVHALLHCGIGFIGLCPAIAEYLMTPETDGDTPLTITLQDIPCADVRAAIEIIKTVRSGATPSEENRAVLEKIATASELNEPITQ